MSKPQYSLLVAALAAILSLLFAPGGLARPSTVSAANCSLGQTGTLVIKLYDEATGALVNFSAIEVLVNPDPRDFDLDHLVVDSDVPDASASEDHDATTGIIQFDDACSTQGAESYTASVYSLPGLYDECDIVDGSDSGKVSVGGTATLELVVDCTGVGPTPTVGPTSTPTATATPMAPSQVTVNASPLEVSCSGTSVITATLRDASNNSVGAGTPVTLSSSFGTLSPGGNQVTNAAGSVVAFFTAPASSGGLATISAVSGALKGMAVVNVKCGGTAAINTVTPSGGTGVITPPNTGDAGLAGSDAATRGVGHLVAGVLTVLAACWFFARRSVEASGR
jgi:hypothetical protein